MNANKILEASGGPALETLPEPAQEAVRTLARSCHVQAEALALCEVGFQRAIDALDAGRPGQALELLREIENRVQRMLESPARH